MLIDGIDEKMLDLLLQQRHLMVLGDCFKCAEQLAQIACTDQRFERAGAIAEGRHVLPFDFLAARASKILQSVGHNFSLNHIQQTKLDLRIIIVNVALRAQPYWTAKDKKIWESTTILRTN